MGRKRIFDGHTIRERASRLVATPELTKKCTGVHSEFPFPLSTGREEGREQTFRKMFPGME